MSPSTRCMKKHAKASKRRYRKAQERLARDRRQAQHAAEALQQALDDLGLPDDLVTEIEVRLRRRQKLLGKIVGMMCSPRHGCLVWLTLSGTLSQQTLFLQYATTIISVVEKR